MRRYFLRNTTNTGEAAHRYYLPGDVVSVDDSWANNTPDVVIPQQDGSTVYYDGGSTSVESYRVSYTLRVDDYDTADDIQTEVDTLEAMCRKYENDKQVEFGYYDDVADSETYWADCTVQSVSVSKVFGAPYKPWIDASYSVTIVIHSPTEVYVDGEITIPPGYEPVPPVADEIILIADTIRLICASELQVQDSIRNVKALIDAGEGDIFVTGDYRFL